MNVSDIAKKKLLRSEIQSKIFSIVEDLDTIILEGRQVGQYIHDLDYYFFITASIDLRVKRRAKQLNVSINKARKRINTRDEKDSLFIRNLFNMHCDAIVLKNTYDSVEEILVALLRYIKL